MRVGSLFSGIGGLDLGLERAGMRVVWQVEIDAFRRRILARHWPDVGRHDDVRDCGYGEVSPQARQQQLRPVDLICGGFPCQDLSVAGRRAGLRAPRSGLFFEFARIVGEVRPAWFLLENVPGLLSSNGGDDFRIVIDTLQGLGYGVAWRILDSRHFGVPQRRRRVYVVGHLGDLRAAAVLFEPEGGGGDTAAGREAGEGVAFGAPDGVARAISEPNASHREDSDNYIAHALTARTTATGRLDPNGEDFVCAPADPARMRAPTGVPRRVDARRTYAIRQDNTSSNGRGISEDESYEVRRGQAILPNVAAPLEAADGHHGRSSPRGDGADNLVAPPLRAGKNRTGGDRPPGTDVDTATSLLAQPTRQDGAEGLSGDAARPCCPDGPRYAALGDAVTVTAALWIGRRIMLAESLS